MTDYNKWENTHRGVEYEIAMDSTPANNLLSALSEYNKPLLTILFHGSQTQYAYEDWAWELNEEYLGHFYTLKEAHEAAIRHINIVMGGA